MKYSEFLSICQRYSLKEIEGDFDNSRFVNVSKTFHLEYDYSQEAVIVSGRIPFTIASEVYQIYKESLASKIPLASDRIMENPIVKVKHDELKNYKSVKEFYQLKKRLITHDIDNCYLCQIYINTSKSLNYFIGKMIHMENKTAAEHFGLSDEFSLSQLIVAYTNRFNEILFSLKQTSEKKFTPNDLIKCNDAFNVLSNHLWHNSENISFLTKEEREKFILWLYNAIRLFKTIFDGRLSNNFNCSKETIEKILTGLQTNNNNYLLQPMSKSNEDLVL